MKINEISKSNYVMGVKQVKKANPIGKEKAADRIELSREAKELSKSTGNLSTVRIAEITKRINDNFYDRDEILKTVADRILESPQFKELIQNRGLDKNI